VRAGQFSDEPSALWQYGRALWAFRREGDCPSSRQQLRAAFRSNRHLPGYLTGDSEWTGRPGAHVETGAEHPARAGQPLWLLDLCRGIVDAEAAAEPEHVGGERLRGHAAHADLALVSAAVPYEVAVPYPVAHVEELTRFPFGVWTDDAGRIRRVRGVASPSGIAMTLDLHDFGVALPAAYWTTFPVA